jgi:hypothetical protein
MTPPLTRVTEHHDVIFDEQFSHSPLEALPSLLANDDSQHVCMDHVPSPLVGSLVDDFQLVIVDLSTSPSNIGPPICTPLSTSSIVTRQCVGAPSSSGPSSLDIVSSNPPYSNEVTTTLDVQLGNASSSNDAQINDDTFHFDA